MLIYGLSPNRRNLPPESSIPRIVGGVDEGSILDQLREFVKTPSLTGEENRLVELTTEKLDRIGHFTEQINGNVIRKRAGGPEGKNVILCGHMDTVAVGDKQYWHHDSFGAEVENGKLIGSGTADVKGEVVSMIGAIAAFNKSRN